MTLSIHLATGVLLALFFLVPLMIKWELSKALTLPTLLAIGLFSGLVTSLLTIPWWTSLFLKALLIGIMAAALLMWRFFRDPERRCPLDGRIIISAADGHVIYVKKFEAGQIPVSEKQGRTFTLKEFEGSDPICSAGYLVGTSMSYLDVHVNRAPIAGETTLVKHIHGHFISLKHPEAVFQNERVATIIESPDLSIGIIQIASRLVRNIIPFVEPGEEVFLGQRIGKIRFGSQVDLIIPENPKLRILVKPGDKLKAGITAIASY